MLTVIFQSASDPSQSEKQPNCKPLPRQHDQTHERKDNKLQITADFPRTKTDDGTLFLGDGSMAAAPAPKLNQKGLRSVIKVVDDRCL